MKPIVAGTVVATVLALVAGKFILQSSKPEAILARFTAFVRAHKSIAVDLDFDCKWDKNESAKGFYSFGRDVGLLFDIKSTNVDYVMSQTLDGSIEQERRQKVYSEAAYPGHFFQPSPELALIGDRSFPSPLFYGALDAGLGRTKLSKLAEAEVAGHRCDVVQIDVIGADFHLDFLRRLFPSNFGSRRGPYGSQLRLRQPADLGGGQRS